ncbi:unnamed protein product [Phaedon cochleariae]|uniref:Acylglycerol kinase, mitochondrial n=1 Tax=Phaedon cochleariae TaxID=80249 RepID=A0A9P0DRP0_PHACE|nr:unnamed protein product [Phaedon cochleariae]
MIVRTAKTIKNHWKKSLFATALVTYGAIYTKNHFQIQELMRLYCQKAAEYGKESIPLNMKPRHITVILNPNANKRKASEEFEKYCAPLLHLAGISVDVKKTESEGHAKTLIEEVHGTDAIVIAGGDGTLSEVITGLLRHNNDDGGNIPIGILPLGKNNTLAKIKFSGGKKLDKVRSLADATMAVIEETIKPADVMKIEILSDSTETNANKPVYAVTSLKWGAYRDAEAKKDSYWYFGPLRKYATYIFNGFKTELTWNCEAIMSYSLPCEGCSNCYKKKQQIINNGWFSRFIKDDPQSEFLRVNNPDCQITHEKKISTTDLALSTLNIIENPSGTEDIPKLVIEIGPNKVEYMDFVRNGFRMEKGMKRDVEEIIEVKSIEINPELVQGKDVWFSIDNEDYEVKPVRITLLPKIIHIFCSKESINV